VLSNAETLELLDARPELRFEFARYARMTGSSAQWRDGGGE
jgi:hypothetical protein